jgi:hypothetical protein
MAQLLNSRQRAVRQAAWDFTFGNCFNVLPHSRFADLHALA